MTVSFGGLIFPLVGTITSVVVTGYYIYQIRQAEGLFTGSLDSYFDMTAEYSAVSGLIVTSFFIIFLLPSFFLKEVAPGLVVSDIIFLSLTLVWMALAQRIFRNLSDMSEKYFSEGEAV